MSGLLKSMMKVKFIFKKGTLRRTLFIYLLIACLFPPALLAGYTYVSLKEILNNKISTGIESSLVQEAVGIENLLNNLDFVSKQFALDGQTAMNVNAYLQTNSISEKAEIGKAIEESFNIVNFTNPNVGLMFYFEQEASPTILFSNLLVRDDMDINSLPTFVKYSGTTYFGPHQTQYQSSQNTVFSSIREVRNNADTSLYIYLESNSNIFKKMMSNNIYGMPVSHYLVSEQQDVIYMESGEPPLSIETMKQAIVHKQDEIAGHYVFNYDSVQGWQLVIAVDKKEYNREITEWLWRMFVLVLGSLVLAFIISMLIWRKVYGPLRKVNLEIVKLTGDREAPVKFIGIEEFDTLLGNFQVMKNTVNDLIAETSIHERHKSQMEIEKLLSQINPHFLHNTLNTVQWMARANEQHDIEHVVTLLVKVLHYNMGKGSLMVTIKNELEAVQHYIDLHKIRYEGEITFHIDIDEQLLGCEVPRFLLQPLVENAIYHGRNDRHSHIYIAIKNADEGKLKLTVQDNGPGLSDLKIQQLLEDSSMNKTVGLGIGLNYVQRMLTRFYDGKALLHIDSKEDMGTLLTVIIPIVAEVEKDDKGTRS